MWWKMDFIWQLVTISSVAGLRRSFKALLKARLAPKKKCSLFGGLLSIWFITAFWILAKPLHLRSMLSKSMRCTESCNACTRHWSTETTQFFSTTENTRPHITQPVLQKLKEFGANFASFVSSTIFTWHLANQLLLLQASQQLIAEKTLPQPEGHRKCSLRVHVITKHGFFSYRNQLISHRQKCVDCNDSYFE